MAYKTLQLRRDTAANWTSNDPTLLEGEMGMEVGTLKMKVGDGSTAWTALAYLTDSGSDAFTVKVDAGATAGYIGATPNDGVLRAGTGLVWTDGGDFVTLNVANTGAAVYNDAEETITTSTITALTFNSERWDTSSFHDNSTNNTRLTCNVAGVYLITGHIEWKTAAGRRVIYVKLNGTTYIAANLAAVPEPAECHLSISTIYNLEINDYVELCVWHNSPPNLGIYVLGNFSPEFRIQRIA